MAIRAVVFDIGGVLEVTPDLGVGDRWERRLRLQPGELDEKLGGVWRGGSVGALSEEEVYRSVGETLGLSETQVVALMEDVWEEYLGTPNVELTEYFRGLRPEYRTALLSNSFVGARRREQERYGFRELCDAVIYSHEEGIEKPDRRIFELTCERLRVRPEETVFLDDFGPHVAAACALGMRGILFEHNAQAVAAVEACIRGNAS